MLSDPAEYNKFLMHFALGLLLIAAMFGDQLPDDDADIIPPSPRVHQRKFLNITPRVIAATAGHTTVAKGD